MFGEECHGHGNHGEHARSQQGKESADEPSNKDAPRGAAFAFSTGAAAVFAHAGTHCIGQAFGVVARAPDCFAGSALWAAVGAVRSNARTEVYAVVDSVAVGIGAAHVFGGTGFVLA